MSKAKILMIEDEAEVLSFNKEYLASQGYDVVGVQTLALARFHLEEQSPDLILLDVMMPDGMGWDFCTEIREKTNAPVIFLSCRDENESIVKGLLRGGDDYITKPYDLNVLGARVAAQLRSGKPSALASLAQAVQAMTEAAVQIQSTEGQATPAIQAITQAVFQPSAEAAAPSVNAAENTAAVLHPSAPETAVKTDAPDMAARMDAPLGEAQNMKTTGMTDNISKMPEHITAAPKEIPEQITDKALAMFMSLEDADELALHLKKAVQDLPEQLKELKVLIEHADNIVKETVAAKFDQIEKQMSIMNEVRRFDCYQIPLQNSQHQLSAAELYVYRYRNGKKKVDPENILILLGLDTQYMGRVETLIKTNGKSLSIEFNLEDMRLSDEIQADTAHLEQTVNEAGYHLAGVSVKPLTSRTTVLNAENRFENETGGSAGNVDVRI